MKLVISKPNYSVLDLIIACYYLNVFYLKGFEAIGQIGTWGFAFIYIVLHYRMLANIIYLHKRIIVKFLLLFLLWFLLIIFAPLFHSTFDFSYLQSLETIIGTLINMLVIMLIAFKRSNTNDVLKSFMHLFVIATVCYVLFTSFCLIIPSLKSIIINNVSISTSNLELIHLRKYATRIGWAGFSGYNVSLKCTIANIFSLYLILNKYLEKRKQSFTYYFSYFVTLLGEFYYSRTGLIASIIILAFTLIFIYKRVNPVTILSSILIIIVLLALFPILNKLAESNSSIAWMLEPLLNFLSDDGFTSTSSTHIMQDMLFLPSLSQMLFGDGYYSGINGYYMKTDLGFMRLILYFGIPGLFATYSLIAYPLFVINKHFKKRDHFWITTVFLIVFLIFEFKGESVLFYLPFIFTYMLVVLNDYSKSLESQYEKQM